MNKENMKFRRSSGIAGLSFLMWAALVLGLAGTTANADLVGHYEFETNADDSAGTNHGTMMGDAKIINDAERGNVLALDGSGDYVDFSSYFVTTTEFTIAAWANQYGLGGGHMSSNVILSQRDNTKGHNTSCILLISELSPGDPGAAAYIRTTNGPYPWQDLMSDRIGYGQWHHYAMTVNSSDFIFYIDGNEVARTTNQQLGDYTTSIDNISIGRNRYESSDAGVFNGTIDDVRIYDRALSESEIRAIVPEPTTILLFAVGGLILGKKRQM